MNVEKKKILLATGGTGGHIYPALMVARVLREQGHDVSFIGVFKNIDILKNEGFSYTQIIVGGFVGKAFFVRLQAIVLLLKALFISRRIIQEFQPDVVVGFGGYASFPTMIMAFFMRIKTMIHDQNVQLGEANKILVHVCDKVCVGFHQSFKRCSSISKKMIWTGTPFRVKGASFSVEEVMNILGLKKGLQVIFVFGGSQGSHAINKAVFEWVEQSQSMNAWQMIHVTGQKEFDFYHQQYQRIKKDIHVFPYMDHIEQAYAVADVAVTRAGAGTITELALLGIPAIIIPYPGAKQHQVYNADVLRDRKATTIILEKDLSFQKLGDNILSILQQKVSRNDLILQMQKDLIKNPAEVLASEILKSC